MPHKEQLPSCELSVHPLERLQVSARAGGAIYGGGKDRGNQLRSGGNDIVREDQRQFGEDGFDDAMKQISAIEGSLRLADIAQFTAPPPPKG